MLVVQKYGGSSLATTERVNHVAKKIIDAYEAGHQVVVVLSAQGKTTDQLIARAKALNPHPPKREMDMLLATGEQQSVALMAMAIEGMGKPVISLSAHQGQGGIHSSSVFSNARIQRIDTDRIQGELERKNIVILTGFQGVNKIGDITTLGRGGSDTTAVAMACALNADVCEIYTDVDGVYTADPHVVSGAKKLTEVSYDEMLELASLGAKVLHNRSVELAKKHHLNLVVKSSLENKSGTQIKERTMEKMLISGLAIDKDVVQVTVIGMKDTPGIAFKLFSMIAKRNITVDVIVQTMGGALLKDIAFTVHKNDLDETLEVLEKNKDFLNFDRLGVTDNLAKLSVVGAGMTSTPGVAAAMFEALYDVGVNIRLISTSEIKISVLIDEAEAKMAANSVHERLMEESMRLNR